jgi:hypothetical protein
MEFEINGEKTSERNAGLGERGLIMGLEEPPTTPYGKTRPIHNRMMVVKT